MGAAELCRSFRLGVTGWLVGYRLAGIEMLPRRWEVLEKQNGGIEGVGLKTCLVAMPPKFRSAGYWVQSCGKRWAPEGERSVLESLWVLEGEMLVLAVLAPL